MVGSRTKVGALCCSFAVMVIAAAPAASTNPSPGRAEPALREVIKVLIEEGRQSWRDRALVRPKPDFAATFAGAVDHDEVAAALLQPAHRDPFIDAYVRWQLTSFDPPLPDVDDRGFLQWMNAAPALIPNPWCEPEAIRYFEEAERAGSLSERDLQRARALVDELSGQVAVAEAMNAPALEFRDFIAVKLGDDGPRPRLWMLERCAALIQAGWPVRNVKTELTKSFSAAAADESLTPEHRALIAEQVRRLIGLQRRFVGDVTFLANGSLRAQFSTAAVDGKDVENWIARMNGTAPR